MAVDALDPSHPTGANQVELSAELRAIKVRLVADKTNIEQLQEDVAPLTGAGGVGLQILADTTDDEVFEDLGVTALGKAVIQDYVDLPALQLFLGITASQVETIVNTSTKGTITWAGGLKIKWSLESVPGGGGSEAFLWDTPFQTICLFGLCTGYGGDDASWLQGPPTITGGRVDHDNSGTTTVVVVGVGI